MEAVVGSGGGVEGGGSGEMRASIVKPRFGRVSSPVNAGGWVAAGGGGAVRVIGGGGGGGGDGSGGSSNGGEGQPQCP